MAGEYRLHSIVLEGWQGSPDASPANLYHVVVEVSSWGAGGMIISSLLSELYHTGIVNNPAVVSTLLSELYHTGIAGNPGRIDTLLAEVLRGLPQDYWPDFLEDDQDLGEFAFTFEPVVPTDDDTLDELPFEWNPYRPDVPVQIADSDRDTYEYLREQAELVRFQHNVTQAGDTTFPYQMIGQPSDTAQFTLGSISRFKHPDYGLIIGRYIEFSDRWDDVNHAWVGHDLGRGDWVGTNQIQYTDVSRVIGVVGPFGSDVSGKFGWTISQGRGLFNLHLISAEEPTQYSKFSWDPAKLGRARVTDGPAVGLIVGPGPFKWYQATINDEIVKVWRIDAGDWAVDINGVTDEYIRGLMQSDLDALEARVAALEEADDSDGSLTEELATIHAQILALQQGLALEQSQRSVFDNAINVRVTALEAGGGGPSEAEFLVLENRVTILETDLTTLASQVTANYNALNVRITLLEAYQSLAESKFEDLYNNITLINGRLSAVEELTGIYMPVVDGSIPPTFIQNPDGGLVYVKVE